MPLHMTRLVGSRALLLNKIVEIIASKVSLFIPEITSNDGVAGIQEDPRGRDDQQEIVLRLCVDKPWMVLNLVMMMKMILCDKEDNEAPP